MMGKYAYKDQRRCGMKWKRVFLLICTTKIYKGKGHRVRPGRTRRTQKLRSGSEERGDV